MLHPASATYDPSSNRAEITRSNNSISHRPNAYQKMRDALHAKLIVGTRRTRPMDVSHGHVPTLVITEDDTSSRSECPRILEGIGKGRASLYGDE